MPSNISVARWLYSPGTRSARSPAAVLTKALLSGMAPARIELAHADSKSAALSTELRGPGVRVDEVRRSLPTCGDEKVVDEHAGHRLAGLCRSAADVWRQDDVREAH